MARNFHYDAFKADRLSDLVELNQPTPELTKAERIANLQRGIEMYTRHGNTEAVLVRVENLNKLLASPRT
jgi:hypothetical protein